MVVNTEKTQKESIIRLSPYFSLFIDLRVIPKSSFCMEVTAEGNRA